MPRREALQLTAVSVVGLAGAAAVVKSGVVEVVAATTASAPEGPFKLGALPYAVDALEPHIDARTMEIHHGRHHAAYVANLNKAVSAHPEHARSTIEALVKGWSSLPEAIRAPVRNNGGGHLNHTLFWSMMAGGGKGGGAPKGELARAIDGTFKDFAGFQAEFSKAALSVFGSGWAWLTRDEAGKLRIETTPNQDNPITSGRHPLLGVDVWEHAYYLKYQNKRVDYVSAFMKVVDWQFVADRFANAGR